MTRVLVVDDDYLMCRLVALVLEHEGHQVRTVSSHFDELLDSACWLWGDMDVLLCDLNLQDTISGLDILAVAASEHPRLRRVALSGADPVTLGLAAELAHMVMRKPTNPMDIVAAIR